MQTFGEQIKELRLKAQLPLRTVAHFLDMDQAILSKIENGKRNASKKQVKQLAAYYQVDEKNLMINYLADKIIYELKDENFKVEILAIAEEKVAYGNALQVNEVGLIGQLKEFFLEETRVIAAYLFGSNARNEATSSSDVDVMIEFSTTKKHTMFDLLDIQHKLQQLLNKKVDVVEKGYVKQFARKSVERDLKLIVQK